MSQTPGTFSSKELLFYLQSMKVKLQPPSGTELSPFSPIQPPAAITQVMLLANPMKVSMENARYLPGVPLPQVRAQGVPSETLRKSYGL